MATPRVSCDTFICGSCQTYFNDLMAFLDHKRTTSCGVTVTSGEADQQTQVTVVSEAPPADQPAPASSSKRKRGRPRKITVERDGEAVKPAAPVAKSVKKTFSIGADGSMTCDVCKSRFRRERHAHSHRCKLSSDYLPPEAIPELEEGFDSRTRFPVAESVGSETNQSSLVAGQDEEAEDDDEEEYQPDGEEGHGGKERVLDLDNESEAPVKRRKKKRKIKSAVTQKGRKRLVATYATPQTLDDIPDIPVFPNEEARLEFEKKEITLVDLSATHDMFRTHVIEQRMNEKGLEGSGQTDISLYSCNKCDRVFKTLSHVRYHCLTHIDSKPFKCPEDNCSYRSNSKGNIYSHMRKHTGQLYRCRTCSFSSVNKTHLLEHEATHSGTVHKCSLCSKHYSTLKSMVQHIRRLHSHTDKGKQYLAQFITPKEGPGAALLYECHICDRKFKKQSDRDRHLYVHNVRVEHAVFTCELCQFETAKAAHLDAHFTKHKYAYSCRLCDRKYLSVQLAADHLQLEHLAGSASDTPPLEAVQLDKSYYLPESKHAVLDGISLSQEGPVAPDNDDQSIYSRLGYQPMTAELFADIRKRLGDNECKECGGLFQTAESLAEHIKSHEGERPFTCVYCSFSAFSRNSLKLHTNAHHEDQLFTCDQCDFVSKGKQTLQEHKQRHEHVQCPLCKNLIPGRKSLRNHLINKHAEIDAETARRLSGYGRRTAAVKGGSNPFKCPHCEKSFVNNQAELQRHLLQRHLLTHEGIKPFSCTLCSYSCRTRSCLASHMLRHCEYKPHPCSVCGKKYKSKTALRWHERSHATGKLFKCHRCSYEGTQKSHLIRHLETHNIIKRYTCNHCVFSANTLAYMRIHYTRFHPGQTYVTRESSEKLSQPLTGSPAGEAASLLSEEGASSQAADLSTVSAQSNVYKCVSCDYLFGNLSDMKRHLRQRHRIHLADMRQTLSSGGLASGQEATITEIVPLENQDGITSAVQVVQMPLDEEGNAVNQYLGNIAHSVSSAIMVGDMSELDGDQIQFVELAPQDGEGNAEGQQLIIHYPSAAAAHDEQTLQYSQGAGDQGNVIIVNRADGGGAGEVTLPEVVEMVAESQ